MSTAEAVRPARVMSMRRAVAVLGLLEVFGPISMDLYMPALPGLARDLGTSDSLGQATMSACMLGLALGQLIAGPLSDRLGRRRPLLVGIALFAVLSLVCAAAPSIGVLVAARFLQGVTGSAGIVITLAVARDLASGVELARLLSLLALVSAVAPILAPVAGGQLAAVMSWRGIFVVLAGIGLALLLVAVTLLRETLPTERRHGGGFAELGQAFGVVLRDRLFLTLLLVASLGGVAFFTYLASISFVLQQQFAVTPQLFSVFFATNSVMWVLGSQVNRVLVRRAGPARMYVVGTTAAALGSLALLGAVLSGAGMVAFLVALALYLLASGISSPNSSTLALSDHGAHAGTAAALFGDMGFVYADTTQNPFQEMALGAEWAAKEDGNVNLKTSAPTPLNNPQEVTMLQSLGRQATDGIAYETVAPELFGRALKDITDRGIPVVAVDAAPPPNSGVKTFVANSNTDLGRLLGDAFVKQNPDPNGTVVLGNDIPSLQLLVQRLDGVQEVLKQKLPNLKLVGPLNSGSTNTENYTLWKSIVNSHPEAEAFIGVGAADGINLPLIEKQSGRNYLIGSADIPDQALQAVKDGQIFALSSPEHWMKGYIAMYLLIHAKRTCTAIPTGWWNSGNLLIDKSNIDAILTRQKSNEARAAFFKDAIKQQLANPPIKPLNEAD